MEIAANVPVAGRMRLTFRVVSAEISLPPDHAKFSAARGKYICLVNYAIGRISGWRASTHRAIQNASPSPHPPPR